MISLRFALSAGVAGVIAIGLGIGPVLAQQATQSPPATAAKPHPKGKPAQKSEDAAKPTAKPTAKPDAKAESKPDSKPGSKSTATTGAKPGAKPGAKTTAPGGGPATLLATFSDWGAYSAQSGRNKLCYALTQPKARQPATNATAQAYLFVSFRPAENVKNEIAVVMGFPAKDGGPAEATINTNSYALVTKGTNAWVKNPAEESQVIATMGKGQALTVTATTARGVKTTDRYSLAGFSQALERARKECP